MSQVLTQPGCKKKGDVNMKYPIKVLLDEKRQPFLPFTTTECVLVDGTDQTMTVYLNNYIAQKNREIQAIIDRLEQYTENRMAELDTAVDNKIKEMETRVNNSITSMETRINNSITNMENSITTNTNSMNNTISTNTAAMVAHIEEETAALDARLAAKEAELDASVATMATYRDETTTNVNSLETEVVGMRTDLGYAQKDLAALTTLDEGATK